MIPDEVSVIGTSAFAGCKKLKKVTIGTGLVELGKNAFYGDKKLTAITIKSKKLTTVKSKAFKNVSANVVINVPNSKVTKYKKLFSGKGLKSTATIK